MEIHQRYVPATFTYTITDTEDATETTIRKKPMQKWWHPLRPAIAAARATYELAIETKKEAQAYLDMLNGEALPENVPGSSLTALVEAQTALQTAEENLKATQLISPIRGIVTDICRYRRYVSTDSISPSQI